MSFLKIKNRRDDAYWPEGKRVAMEDRYRPDFPRPDHRFHDFDHRDRGQYQDHVADRSAPPSLAAVDGATSARRRDGSLSSDVSFTREAPRSWPTCCTWDLQGHACSRMWDSGPLGHPQLISRSALFTDWWRLWAIPEPPLSWAPHSGPHSSQDSPKHPSIEASPLGSRVSRRVCPASLSVRGGSCLEKEPLQAEWPESTSPSFADQHRLLCQHAQLRTDPHAGKFLLPGWAV